ncbi:MAG: non-reducing end alpha-L-arabinofuranosidase family hydrolase [Planctomycetota bacterium]
MSFGRPRLLLVSLVVCLTWVGSTSSSDAQVPSVVSPFQSGGFQWHVGPPLVSVNLDRLPDSPQYPWVAIKDPSVVRHDGRWHLFCTLRNTKQGDGRIRIGYACFASWEDASESKWELLELTPGYHGAPQIFYFRPHRLWYLIYQAVDQTRNLSYGPCYSTNADITDASAWTLPRPLYVVPEGTKAGLDYWVICDGSKAHLFFTTLNGKMWRSETALQDFPDAGWSVPGVALTADIFEASHTYKLKGQALYFTIVEAQADRRRYFKGFVAARLDGNWRPIAATADRPLVSPINVVNQEQSWATSYSHGEFLRSGSDERLEIDPSRLQLVFQGANDEAYQQEEYSQIPWQLGLLEQR